MSYNANKKSMNVDPEELEEGEQGPGKEKLAKNALSASTPRAPTARIAGNPSSTNPAPMTFKSIWEGFYEDPLSKAESDLDSDTMLFVINKAIESGDIEFMREDIYKAIDMGIIDINNLSLNKSMSINDVEVELAKSWLSLLARGGKAATKWLSSLFSKAPKKYRPGSEYKPITVRDIPESDVQRLVRMAKKVQDEKHARTQIQETVRRAVEETPTPIKPSIVVKEIPRKPSIVVEKTPKKVPKHHAPETQGMSTAEKNAWYEKLQLEAEGVNKSLKSLESQYGSQLSKSFDVPTSCGICNRITKSLDGNVCKSCKDSMNNTQWHDSHLG